MTDNKFDGKCTRLGTKDGQFVFPPGTFVPCDTSKLLSFGPWRKIEGEEKWACTIPPELIPLAIEAGVDIHWRFDEGEEDD